MAARENQGYLIAVIILVLLTLVLALAAFLGMSRAAENAEAKAALEKDKEFLNSLSQANEIKGEIFKALIGDHGPMIDEIPLNIQSMERLATNTSLESAQQQQIQAIIADVKAVEAAYKSDMTGSVTTEDGQQKKDPTYREKLTNLTAIVAKKNNDYFVQVSQTRQAEKDAQTKIASMEKTVEANEAARAKAETDLAQTKRDSLIKEQKLKDEVKAFTIQLDDEKQKYDALAQKKSAEIRGLNEELTKSQAQNETLKLKINRLTREVFDRADGSIVKVASRLESVFIDLGSEDGLMNNMTFAVYDNDVTNFEKDQHKAMIEVTRVYPFRAEARITNEDPTNPILGGDQILTATWDPGFSVQFAVAGVFDLDGDGFDDYEKLLRMIERNGGKVVARHDSDGNISGKLDADVRYFVKGDAPRPGEDFNPLVVSAMKEMEEMADQNTVDKIGLQKLLNRMGVRAKPKTLKLQSNAGGFQERDPRDTLKSDDS